MDDLSRHDLDERLRAIGESAPVTVDMRTARPLLPASFVLMRRTFASVYMTDTALDNFTCARTARQVRDDSVPWLTLSVPTAGVRFEQDGRQVVSIDRSIVSYWSTAPYSQHILRATRTRTVTIPLVDLGLPTRLVREVVGRDIGSSPLGGLIRGHLRELAELPELDADAAHSLARPVLDLLRALISLRAGDEGQARGALNHTLGTRIMIHLRAHVQDVSLSADGVAARFGISKRYLYVVLGRSGVTFGEWVRAERLRRAAEALRDPALADLSIAGLALSIGFVDHSSFSRAFRDAFGCSPSDWRAGSAHAAVARDRPGDLQASSGNRATIGPQRRCLTRRA